MKNLFLFLFSIMATVVTVHAQTYCNLIDNPTLDGCNCGSSDPFNIGNVPGWEDVVGTPSMSSDNHSPLVSGAVWSRINGGLSGEAFGQPIAALVPGKTYVYSFWVKQDFSNPLNTGTGPVYGALGMSSTVAGIATLNGLGAMSKQQLGTTSFNGTAGPWIQLSGCFTATQAWDYIAFWGAATTSTTMWVLFDDVELFEVKPFAGQDTFICGDSIPVTLGDTACGDSALSPMNISESFQWTELGSGTVVGTSSQLTVTAFGRKKYVLEHTLSTDSASCTDYDTVEVCQSLQPTADLGPDDTLCPGVCMDLNLPSDTSYTYWWNTGDTGSTITVCSAGTYIGIVTTACGCSDTDTVTISYYPEIVIDIPDTQLCESELPFTVSAPPGYAQYQWSGGGTGNTKLIGAGGNYSVTVTDVNGCTKTDAFTVTVWEINTGLSDTSICDAALPVTVSVPAGYAQYQWSTGSTANSTSVGSAGTYTVTVTDGHGCTKTDELSVTTFSIDAAIDVLTDTSDLCDNFSIELHAYNANNPLGSGYLYQWSTGQTSANITVNANGTYWVKVYSSDSVCMDSVAITLNIPPCCNLAPQIHNMTISVNTVWSNTMLTIDGTITVNNHAQLTISNSKLNMLPCSKIIVERGSDLVITGSEIGMCSTGWQGIEVWGHIDACPNDLSQQAKLVATNSFFRHADIAVFAGNRAGKTYAGGVLVIENCVFEDNFVDIMFEEWNMAGVCNFNCNPHGWQSHVWYNQFLPIRHTEYCTSYATGILSQYGFGNAMSHCNIIDMSWNPNVYTIPTYPPFLRCNRDPMNPADVTNTAAGTSAYPTMPPGGLVFDHNTYAMPCFNPHYNKTGETGQDGSSQTSATDRFALQITPNPVSGEMTVTLQEAPGVYTLDIRDVLGKTVWSGKINCAGSGCVNKVDLGNVASGSYLVIFTRSDGWQASRKIIVR